MFETLHIMVGKEKGFLKAYSFFRIKYLFSLHFPLYFNNARIMRYIFHAHFCAALSKSYANPAFNKVSGKGEANEFEEFFKKFHIFPERFITLNFIIADCDLIPAA